MKPRRALTRKFFRHIIGGGTGLALTLGALIPPVIPPEWAGIEPVMWDPPSWEEVAAAGTVPEQLPPLIDTTDARGLTRERVLNTDTGVEAGFLLTMNDSALNTHTIDVMTETIAQQARESEKEYAPQVHGSGFRLDERGCQPGSVGADAEELLAGREWVPATGSVTLVTCEVSAAADDVLVQQLRTIHRDSEGDLTDRPVTLIYHRDTDTVITGAAVWDEEQLQEVWDAIVQGIHHAHLGVSLAGRFELPDTDTLTRVLESTVIDPDGNFFFVLPAGLQVSALQQLGFDALPEPVTVRFSFDAASPLLSAEGQTLVEQLRKGEPYASPEHSPVGFREGYCDLFPCVALTYDDGPSSYTPVILDSLATHGASASFFLVGKNVAPHADTVLRTVEEGHLALNHSWKHSDLTKLSLKKALGELNRTNTEIFRVTGVVPNAFRPPYGEFDDELVEAAKMPAILWDVDTEDWQGSSNEELTQLILEETQPGSIVLQHDIHENTAETVESVILGLQAQGYSLVNLRQLFGEMPAGGNWQSGR